MAGFEVTTEALAEHDIGKTAVADRNLLEDVVRHKNIFFRASYTNYEARLSGGLRLVPTAVPRQNQSAFKINNIRGGCVLHG